MAREVQRAGTRALGGPHLRPRPHPAARLAPGSHLPRRVGQRAFPVAVRAGAERAGVSDPDARVASADRDAVGDGRTQPALRTPQARRAPRGRRPAPPHRAGDAKRHARVLSRGAPRDRAAQARRGDGLPAPPAATRPARRPAPRGVDTLAPAGEAGAGAAVAPDGVGLERAVDTARPAVTGARNAPAVRRGLRAPRRGARLLGPRGTRGDSRRRPAARGGGGPRRGEAAPPASLVAPGSGARAGARAGVRRSSRRSRARAPVGRRRPAGPGRGPAGAQHRRTIHGRNGHDSADPPGPQLGNLAMSLGLWDNLAWPAPSPERIELTADPDNAPPPPPASPR